MSSGASSIGWHVSCIQLCIQHWLAYQLYPAVHPPLSAVSSCASTIFLYVSCTQLCFHYCRACQLCNPHCLAYQLYSVVGQIVSSMPVGESNVIMHPTPWSRIVWCQLYPAVHATLPAWYSWLGIHYYPGCLLQLCMILSMPAVSIPLSSHNCPEYRAVHQTYQLCPAVRQTSTVMHIYATILPVFVTKSPATFLSDRIWNMAAYCIQETGKNAINAVPFSYEQRMVQLNSRTQSHTDFHNIWYFPDNCPNIPYQKKNCKHDLKCICAKRQNISHPLFVHLPDYVITVCRNPNISLAQIKGLLIKS